MSAHVDRIYSCSPLPLSETRVLCDTGVHISSSKSTSKSGLRSLPELSGKGERAVLLNERAVGADRQKAFAGSPVTRGDRNAGRGLSQIDQPPVEHGSSRSAVALRSG